MALLKHRQSIVYQDYVLAAMLQELLMVMGHGGQILSESLGAVQTDFDPPDTQQIETTPQTMPACAQWGIGFP